MNITRVIDVSLFKDKLIEKMTALYGGKHIPHGIQFKMPWGTVNIYSSGKLVYQGSEEGFKEITSLFPLSVEEEVQFPSIGCDEAGKGEYLGPIVVSCVWVRNKDMYFQLRDRGFMDSKKLGDRKEELYTFLKGTLGNNLKVGYKLLTPPEFDRAYAHSGNIARILDFMYTDVIYRLPEAESVLIDQYSSGMLLPRFVRKSMAVSGAEKYFHVGAASVVARVIYDKWVRKNVPDEVISVLGKSHVSINDRKKAVSGIDISRWVKNAFKSD